MVSIAHGPSHRRKKVDVVSIIGYATVAVLALYLPYNLYRLLSPTTTTTTTQQVRSLPSLQNELSSLQDRLTFLETKLDSFLSFGSDPFRGFQKKINCQHSSDLREYCPKNKPDCDVDQSICLDDFPYNNCVVYDFGIRKDPEFGEILSQPPFNCQVFAFDPSPITKKWYKDSDLKKNPNYRLFDYGAGGQDEEITLREYNWNQVTIYQYPNLVVDPTNCDENGNCKYKKFDPQVIHKLPVRSLPSVMKELGHEKIDVLKLDIEGSEYRFLESAITSGVCQSIDQVTLEWHHYGYDERYGTSSSPHINMFVALLEERCGLYQFDIYDDTGGWPANDKVYTEMGVRLMYNLAAFMRKKE